jgi:hypothetical protein
LVVRANPAPATATHRLAAALVAEYLQTARLPYTLSLFLPEAGLQGSARQSREEITAALRLTSSHTSEDGCASLAASSLARAFDACATRCPDEPLALQLLFAITGACGGAASTLSGGQ